jgi:hypothetical protein
MEDANKVEQALSVEKVRQIEGSGENNVDEKKKVVSLLRLFMACMVSGGIQYGWALQLSLLSPYSQVRRSMPLLVPTPFTPFVGDSVHVHVDLLSDLIDLLVADSWDSSQVRFLDLDLRTDSWICGE